jgi:phosphoribosylglycinamide formyltransferase 1
MESKKRLVVLISGRGSNMAAILRACQQNDIAGQIVAVISNKASAAGLQTASESGVATEVIDHTAFDSREAFDNALLQSVLSYKPDYVILAGFMRILTGVFVRPLLGRLVNIHPSLLPKYPGLNTHQRAIDAGDEEAGATVHFVTEELDGGPAILQVRVPVYSDDNADTLADRVLGFEHQLYIEAVKLLCDNHLKFNGEGRILHDGQKLPETGLQFQPSVGN